MEDRHAIAVLGERLEDLVEYGIGQDDRFAQLFLLGGLKNRPKLP